MVAGTTFEEARATRKHYVLPNGTGFWKSEYIISDQSAAPAPHALLVEQDPEQVILPHFHEQNQFQVIVNGGGTLGRSEVTPITVHYAGAYTGYGPITSGKGGLWYFTLRPMMDNGAQFLPESRAKMKPWPKKHWHSAPIGSAAAGELACLVAVRVATIQVDPDGMLIQTIRIPPNGKHVAPSPAPGGGQFFLVTVGQLVVAPKVYSQWSCIWVAHTDEAITLEAGAAGVEVLLAQCPRADYRPTFRPDLYKYPD
ncbi:MAG: hypothetical protein ACKVQU_15360 [Burkholderiales bacterium]